jgi:hypothetical protein
MTPACMRYGPRLVMSDVQPHRRRQGGASRRVRVDPEIVARLPGSFRKSLIRSARFPPNSPPDFRLRGGIPRDEQST